MIRTFWFSNSEDWTVSETRKYIDQSRVVYYPSYVHIDIYYLEIRRKNRWRASFCALLLLAFVQVIFIWTIELLS